MTYLASELQADLKRVLLGTGKFGSIEDLRTVFQVEKLSPYLPALPDNANNAADRVDKTVQYLSAQGSDEDQSVLVLFLKTLMTIHGIPDSELYLALEELVKKTEDQKEVYDSLQDQQAVDSPYLSLSPFQKEDVDYFFGRELVTNKLVNAVHHNMLVPVIGASGTGKSSVVSAGLIPCLVKEGKWLIASLQPRGRVLASLAETLLVLSDPDLQLGIVDRFDKIQKLAEQLRQKDYILYDAVKQLLSQYSAKHLLLVIDQFEELYTYKESIVKENQLFLDMLLRALHLASDSPILDLHIVITLRADFLEQALSYGPWADAMQQAEDLKLGPMSSQQLRDVIEKPARARKVRFQEGLVEDILDGMSKNPGNLPLLEFALDRLWEKQKELNGGKIVKNTMLSKDAYLAIGGVEKALADYAEAIYAKTLKTEKEKESARKVFVQLVHPGWENPGSSAEDTRRISTRQELQEDGWAIANQLAQQSARLIVIDANSQGQKTAEIIHEALIKHWDRLQGWINADRQFRAWQDRLRAALQQWVENKETDVPPLPVWLLSGAKRWIQTEKRGQDLSKDEKEYLFCGILNGDEDIQEWIPLYGDINETLVFLYRYVDSEKKEKREKGIESLQDLEETDREDDIYEHLQKIVLYDEDSDLRKKAAEVIYVRGHISKLISLLEDYSRGAGISLHFISMPDFSFGPRQKRYIIQAIGSVCNLPSVREQIKPLLRKYKERNLILNSATLQIIQEYRNQLALVIALSYAFLQIGYLVILQIPGYLEKIFNLTISFDSSIGFLDGIVTIVIGAFFIIRHKKIDRENITIKECITIGILSSLIANVMVIISALVTLLISMHNLENYKNINIDLLNADSQNFVYQVYMPLYSTLASLVGIPILALSLREDFRARRTLRNLFGIVLFSSLVATLFPFLIGFLLQYFVFFRVFLVFPKLILLLYGVEQFNFSLLNQGWQTLVTNIHILFSDIVVTFCALLGFRYGLFLTDLDLPGTKSSGWTTAISSSSNMPTMLATSLPTSVTAVRDTSRIRRILLPTLILLILGGGIAFFYIPQGKRIALNFTGAALWTATTGGPIRSAPVVVNGIVYVGSDNHQLYAFNAATGATLWTETAGGPIRSAPVVVNGIVYVTPYSGDSSLYAFNAQTGNLLWKDRTGVTNNFSPIVANGFVYTDETNSQFFTEELDALNGKTGKLVWKAPLDGTISYSPVATGNTVYVNTDTNKLYAFDAKTGKSLWTVVPGGNSSSPAYYSPAYAPLIKNHSVYVVVQTVNDTKLYAFDARTGRPLSANPLVNSTYSLPFPPVVAGNIIYIAISYKDINAIDLSTGQVLWTFTAKGQIDASPLIINNVVYIGADEKLYARDVRTGQVLWTTSLGYYSSSSSLLISNNTIVYASESDLNLYAFDAKTGNILWIGTTGTSADNKSDNSFPNTTLVSFSNGILYAGSDNAKIYAFQLPGIK